MRPRIPIDVWAVILLVVLVPRYRTLQRKNSSELILGCEVKEQIGDLTPCHCDAVCKFYDDCCHRFDKTTRFFSCQDMSKLSVKSPFTSAFVFDRCPPGKDTFLRKQCERTVIKSEGIDRKVVIVGTDGRLFRNVYCALCHGAEFKEPELVLECSEQFVKLENNTSDTTLKMNDVNEVMSTNANCKLKNKIKDTRLRFCQKNKHLVDKCPKKHKALIRKANSNPEELEKDFKDMTRLAEIKKNCTNSATEYVSCWDSKIIYRNKYCAICNNRRQFCIRPLMAPNQMLTQSRRFLLGQGKTYSYSILTDFKRFLKPAADDTIGTLHDDATTDNITFHNSSYLNVTEQPEPQNSVTSYLTLTFCILSALGLVLLLLLYAIIPPLRNFGGVLTMSLASSLLVGLFCFLIGPQVVNFAAACRSIAVLMYFAYLSSFAWMSLFAADVLKTFSSSGATVSGSRGSNVKRFCKFAVAGWLLPLIITISAVTVDEVWPNTAASPGFGNGQCYFNSKYGLLSWFYVPVAIAVVANVIISGVVISIIWRTTQQTKRVSGGGSQKTLILLSLKVTAIFGLTWVFGLSAALVDNAVFSEIAGLVNSLQGALISLSFLLSSRTIRHGRTSLSFSRTGSPSTQYSAVKRYSRDSKCV